ncbi:MAG TPA: hypothetical protein PLP50_15220 [Thermoanaerobaculia bacterium]|nr:hypothetical protein [Thermoanaerobaculia bacterium]HPA52944.1 hypothetical protein [Thermoanaerobaculia bacterium]HQN09561.1 hypothetical protein [Thermoanaerobaculia bacterium]HQP86168.1 hypothetical protein [Thermoanaerobaculia bacterium]
MARPNYSHSKRQREIAKKQKREEKMARKLEKKNTVPGAPSDENLEVLEGGEGAVPDASPSGEPEPAA